MDDIFIREYKLFSILDDSILFEMSDDGILQRMRDLYDKMLEFFAKLLEQFRYYFINMNIKKFISELPALTRKHPELKEVKVDMLDIGKLVNPTKRLNDMVISHISNVVDDTSYKIIDRMDSMLEYFNTMDVTTEISISQFISYVNNDLWMSRIRSLDSSIKKINKMAQMSISKCSLDIRNTVNTNLSTHITKLNYIYRILGNKIVRSFYSAWSNLKHMIDKTISSGNE